MDFFNIKERPLKNGTIEVYPDFRVCRSKDLMVRGKSFYAVWDEEAGLWSTDEYDVQRLMDQELRNYYNNRPEDGRIVTVKYLGDFSSRVWMEYRTYILSLADSSTQLDTDLSFANSEISKDSYVSKRLPYPLAPGEISAYEELIGTLYSPKEREKLEWAIGSIIAGDAKSIQKFIVLYGAAGAGKSTILNIIQKLFAGYYTTFESKSLTSSNNAFSTEVFKDNPLVAIQHDGDLSKIEDNTKLNSIVSHEEMTMNEKYKPSYTARINAFLFMATNRPVKITDAKSGIIRRLIDVQPSGEKLPESRYNTLISQINFELGAVAQHCLDVYQRLGIEHYTGYRSVEMILQTDVFYNFIEYHFDTFKDQDGISLDQAYEMYKVFCETSLIEYKTPKYKFREELKNYFNTYKDRDVVDGVRVRSWYSGFNTEKFTVQVGYPPEDPLVLDSTSSIFDGLMLEAPAQYANDAGTPMQKWDHISTKLKDLDTTRVHYVRPPTNHIVIDFDLKDSSGEKSAEMNLEAASKWPSTYSEFSQGGAGIHLHYHYDGDVHQLSRIFGEGIEVKVFVGHSSLRRRLSYCNTTPISTLNSGLPLKEKKLIDLDGVKSEKALRNLILRNLNKQIHPGTKPSIDFIHKILKEAYDSGLKYNVEDLRRKVLSFANNSSNQALYCIRLVQEMQFVGKETDEEGEFKDPYPVDDRLVFYDVEVFPNLVIVCWKYQGDKQVQRLVNPKPPEIEALLKMKLVGFYNRRYDNHILYALFMGFSIKDIFKLSQEIIEGKSGAMFGEAYDLSYADVYEFSSKKQTLKKFQVELGLVHHELNIPWTEPVAEELWDQVGVYCENDVVTTEQVFDSRKQDFVARQILADLSGLPINATTQKHTAKIVFGNERNPQKSFKYTDLSTIFPGYVFDMGKSHYRGEVPGEGGYVYSEPGMYKDVAVLDVASMHPTSIVDLNLFGDYTKNFQDLLDARLAIKGELYDVASKLLGGKLTPYLDDKSNAKELSYALKIVINIVYGLTSASFDNPFRDIRNVDNIVAKRGALFMIDLKNAVQAQGFQVIHIKTDSIKIPDATDEIIKFVQKFGVKYGYTFEHETTYSKFCLVNDAVYVAHKDGEWDTVGAQFQHPYVRKWLFTNEAIEFEDLCEMKSVTTSLYLDFDGVDTPMVLEHGKRFIGKTGLFCPVLDGSGGGTLLRKKGEEYHAVSGTKGYYWMEAEVVKNLGFERRIDTRYFEKLVDSALTNISKFGDYEWLIQ